MFQKKALVVGIAAALGAGSAIAAFDLDNAKQTTNTVALETLDSTGGQTVGTATYPKITNDTSNLDISAKTGVGVSSGQDLFFRFDLTNGVFGADPTFTTANATVATAQGGTAGAAYAIFQATATADIPQNQATTMAAASYAVADASAGVGISMVVYETLTAATSQGDALVTKSGAADLLSFATGLKLTAAGGTETADVETGFTKFVGGTTTENIGSSVLSAAAGVIDAGDGQAVALSDMINEGTSTVLYSGDFGVTGHSLAISSNDCGAGATTTLTANTDKTADAGTTTVTVANASSNFCYVADGKAAIPKGNYTISYTLKSNSTTATNPTTSLSGTTGTILHNGTTVELPYLTTFEDYNQRVVMVNRGSSDANYTFSAFQTEDGTTATAGTAATGTIPAGGTMIVKVTDIVTLTGNTRTAGTVNIVAPTGNISVATTQVNKSDGGTDTISLH